MQRNDATFVLEIRSYVLRPGTRDEFHRILDSTVIELVREAGIRVVRYGPSLHDDVSYVLIRAYDSLEHMKEQEDGFYGSDVWQRTWRHTILEMIVHYQDVVFEVDESLIEACSQPRSG